MNKKIINLIEELKTLTLLEASELVKEIEVTFGVDIAKSSISVSNVSAQPEIISEIKEEKTSFDILLTDVPSDKKIAILKVIRSITGLGLKESKEIVDNFPKMIKEGISKEEVESIKKEIENAGGKIATK